MIYAATIFLSSFLLFLVQPLVARLILPWFGGSAAVWTTCMLFFQVMLLAGYAYAHFLTRKLAASLSYSHTWRTSDVPSREYSQNVVGIRLTYSLQ